MWNTVGMDILGENMNKDRFEDLVKEELKTIEIGNKESFLDGVEFAQKYYLEILRSVVNAI